MGARVSAEDFRAANVDGQLKAVAVNKLSPNVLNLAFITPSPSIVPKGPVATCTTNSSGMECSLGSTSVPLTNCVSGVYTVGGVGQPATFCDFTGPTSQLQSYQQISTGGSAGTSDNSWAWILGVVILVIVIFVVIYAARRRNGIAPPTQ